MGDFGPFFSRNVFLMGMIDPPNILPNFYIFYPSQTSISFKPWSQNGDLAPFEPAPFDLAPFGFLVNSRSKRSDLAPGGV